MRRTSNVMSQTRTRPVIVIDGPAGAGKSTVARAASRALGLPFLDTGAIYRAITLVMTRDRLPAEDLPELRSRLRSFRISFRGEGVFLGDEDVTAAIRTPEIDAAVSPFSALPVVRSALLGIQRDQAASGLVAEGRDMGTVVFPDADLKIFMTASAEERARRRCAEREAKGVEADYEATLAAIVRRDEIDSTRETAPLKPADDAVIIDTTGIPFDDVVERVLELARDI